MKWSHVGSAAFTQPAGLDAPNGPPLHVTSSRGELIVPSAGSAANDVGAESKSVRHDATASAKQRP
jgi:hypothetical protein